MAPFRLRDAILKQLRATLRAMTSPEFMLELDEQPTTVQTKAAMQLLQVHRHILKLENAQLSDIRDELLRQEDDLTLAIEDLKEAQEDLAEIEQNLEIATQFFRIVGRVLSFV